MLRLYRRVDGDRHPFHQSSMDQLLVLLKVNDTESCLELHLDVLRLRHLGAVHQHLLDEPRILGGRHLDGYPPLVDAHLDESDDWQEDAELLHRPRR
jgi:hypothetical protein